MTATPQLALPTTSPAADAHPLVQGALALDFALPSGLPAVPQAPALTLLVGGTDERVYADLSRRVRILGLTTSAASRHRTERSHVRSVHVFQPHPDVAEAAAH